ncbi:MAG: hypothetical protein GF383_13410 [Candidatus Lokiarchaeota archaeon]|nr:hypothetical protein [Candidatus Lokiarchaeota archaeon]MBD3342195.1 hypothetical protein [Candidatus Lokiarchaeota archaeon]
MKKRAFFAVIGVILLFLSTFQSSIDLSTSNQENNRKESYPCHTFDEWKNFILYRNNISKENLNSLPLELIKSIDIQAEIYTKWSNGIYNNQQKNYLLHSHFNSPYIVYKGPQNRPIKNIDFKSNTDEKFELEFLLGDFLANERVMRVYSYIDFEKEDSSISEGNQFFDGSVVKHYGPDEVPPTEDLNPGEGFMGSHYTQILSDFSEWSKSEKYYNALKYSTNGISDAIFFHVKVLYKTEIYESDGWNSYYRYINFNLERFWTQDFQSRLINIVDDDQTPPTLSNVEIINPIIFDDLDEIEIEIDAHDNSDISNISIDFRGINYFDSDKDFRVIIPNPRTPGNYSFIANAIDADNDRPNDGLKTSICSSFKVLDDDIDNPLIESIEILNTPIYDNMSSIDFFILVEDESGIDKIFVDFNNTSYQDDNNDGIVSIPNPKKPGVYECTINVLDNDIDRPNDQLNSSELLIFEVIDDDTSIPNILGFELLNHPIYDSSSYIDIVINVTDKSNVDELYVEFLENRYYDVDHNFIIRLPNPIIPNSYEFMVVAIDADSDHPGDRMTSKRNFSFEVFDDDLSPPEILDIIYLNAPIYDNQTDIEIEVVLSDPSGISELYIIFAENIYHDDDFDNLMTIPNPFIPGVYDFEVYAVDGDDEYEGDQLASNRSFEFEVFDDDLSPPDISEIEILNGPIFDSSKFIDIKVNVSDDSGLSELFIILKDQNYYDENDDNIIRLPNPVIPGSYDIKIYAFDNDTDYFGDILNSSVSYSFFISDDDIINPEIKSINLLNEPIYDTHDYIELEILVEDESGIRETYVQFNNKIYYDYDSDNVIRLPSPRIPGIYECLVRTEDADADYKNDSLVSIRNFSFSILDDDITPPIIASVDILNFPIYDNFETIEIEVNISDESGVSEYYLIFEDGICFDEDEDNVISLPNPVIPGVYQYSLFAKDADDEYIGDSMNSSEVFYFEVKDDDTTAPEIIVTKTEFGWIVKLRDDDGISDSNATGEYRVIDQFGSILKLGILSEECINYSIAIPVKPGKYYLYINSSNNDLEWTGDEEITSLVNIINLSLGWYYEYVIKQIGDLKKFVKDNVWWLFALSINLKLTVVQKCLLKAYDYLKNESLTKTLICSIAAQCLVSITKIEVMLYELFCFIEEEKADYIVNQIRIIRDNILLLMGFSVDYVKQTSLGSRISRIGVKLFFLKNIIFQNISICKSTVLIHHIYYSVIFLEFALFQLALDEDIADTLNATLEELDSAIERVTIIEEKGMITSDFAQYLDYHLREAKSDVQNLLN